MYQLTGPEPELALEKLLGIFMLLFNAIKLKYLHL